MKPKPHNHLSQYEDHSEVALILYMTLIIYGFSFLMRIYVFGPHWDVGMVVFTGLIPIGLIWAASHIMKRFNLSVIMLISPLVALAAEILHEEIFHQAVLGQFSWQKEGYSFRSYMTDVYFSSLIYFAWQFGYFTITNHFRFVRESLAVAEARMQAQGAQLAMLRYQINPHFLFNTLNSISALTLGRQNSEADEMIGALSRFLRYSLDKDDDVKTSLRQEINIIREYLAIEKIRFQDKLNVRFDIEDNSLDCLIPSLILQPAIENVIKHAIAPFKTKGYLRVKSAINDKRLYLSVIDTGPGCNLNKPANGIGLQNMRERINVMYGEKGQLLVTCPLSGGTDVTIIIPVEVGETIMEPIP